jgi:hypothetical protein
MVMDGRVRILCVGAMTLLGSVGCVGMQTRPPEPLAKSESTTKTPRDGEASSPVAPRPDSAQPVAQTKSESGRGATGLQNAQYQEPTEAKPNQLPPPRSLPGPIISEGGVPGSAKTPTAMGGLLNLGPNESPIERAIELAQRLGTVEAEKAALVARTQQLEGAIETRDRMLAESAREADQAIADIAMMRENLRALRQELSTQLNQSRQSEQADAQALQSIRASLLRILEPSAPKPVGGGQ